MSGMERFTQRARRVLSLAHQEAERMRHNYIGTEHLLLGLIREDGGVAGRVLRELGLDITRVQEMVERLVGQGDYLEIWSPELWNVQAAELQDAETNAARFSMLSISTR